MRDDVTALVNAWDKKTAKKAKHYGGLLESLDGILGDEVALSVAPAMMTDPERERGGAWGVLCLTNVRLIFAGQSGQARFDLADIAELNIYRGGGESILVSMSVGGLIEVRVGAESSFFEVETQSATAHIWPSLQEQWAAEKDRARNARRSAPDGGTASSSVADELAKFAELRAQGILSDDEFLRQKQRLLG